MSEAADNRPARINVLRNDPLDPKNVDRLIEELFYLYDDLYADYYADPVNNAESMSEARAVQVAMNVLTHLREEEII